MTALPQVAAEDPSARVVAPGRLGYRPGLDGIRALAVLAVMVHHAPRQVLLGGQMGVQVFFVLSGFLITVLLLEERAKTGRVSLRAFYVRRALRLLPAAYTVILVGIVLVAVGATTAYGLSSTLGEAFAGALYWDDWYRAFELGRDSPLGHLWSLSVEEQFYLLWPVVLIVALRKGWKTALAFCAIGALAVVVSRALLFGELPAKRLYFGADFRSDGLLVGCAFGLIWWRLGIDGLKRAFTVAAPLALIVLAWELTNQFANETPATMHYGFALTDGASLALIGAVMTDDRFVGRLLSWRPLVWLGGISYGVYLWHLPIFDVAAQRFGSVQYRYLIPVEFVVAIGVAAASYYLIEQPFLRLRRRFTPARA